MTFPEEWRLRSSLVPLCLKKAAQYCAMWHTGLTVDRPLTDGCVTERLENMDVIFFDIAGLCLETIHNSQLVVWMFSEVDPNTAWDGVLHLWNERVRNFACASVCSMLALVASFTCSTRKAEATGFPVWIISLDLSKAFDRARWPALWTALFEQRVPQHFIWISQRVCYGQHAEIVSDFGQSNQFPIAGGVRQGCVLTPRLFCAVLEFAMRKWKHAVGQAGIDLLDGGPNLLDLTFRGWHSDFCPLTSRTGAIDRFIADTFGTGRFAVECGKDRGANQWGATASNSCDGWRAETYNLAAPCWSKVVGLHVDSRRVTITTTTHRSGISSLEISAFCGKSTAWPLAGPHFHLAVQGTSKYWSSTKHFGHDDPEIWAIGWMQHVMPTGGQIWCCNLLPSAPTHAKHDLKGISVYKL